MNSNRRDFIVRSTLAVAASALGSSRLFAQQPAAPAPPTVPVFASLRRNVGTFTARGGKIGLIGFLAGREGDTNPTPLMMVGGSLHGIFVGDREMFEEMNRAIAVNRLTPVIDRVFPFDSAPAAYEHQASRAFVGKIVITV